MKTIIKYKILFPILALLYLNFYFLSPFIHEHALEIEGKVETENFQHSHVSVVINIISTNLNNEGLVAGIEKSHTHFYSFHKPILISRSHKFHKRFAQNTSWQNDDHYEELVSKFDIINTIKFHDQILWEKYVHFAANNSPPSIQSIRHS